MVFLNPAGSKNHESDRSIHDMKTIKTLFLIIIVCCGCHRASQLGSIVKVTQGKLILDGIPVTDQVFRDTLLHRAIESGSGSHITIITEPNSYFGSIVRVLDFSTGVGYFQFRLVQTDNTNHVVSFFAGDAHINLCQCYKASAWISSDGVYLVTNNVEEIEQLRKTKPDTFSQQIPTFIRFNVSPNTCISNVITQISLLKSGYNDFWLDRNIGSNKGKERIR